MEPDVRYPRDQRGTDKPKPALKRFTGFVSTLLVATVLIAGLCLFWFIPAFEEVLIAQKKTQVQDLVRTVWFRAKDLHTQAEQGKLSEAEAKAIFLKEVDTLRYGSDLKSYYWVNDFSGHFLVHPYTKGATLTVRSPGAKQPIIDQMHDAVSEEGEGFLHYRWQLNDANGLIAQKTSFVKVFAPWELMLGSGFYDKDIIMGLETQIYAFLKLAGGGAAVLLVVMTIGSVRYRKAQKTLVQTEKNLREEQDRLQHMSQHVKQGMAIFRSSKLTFCNHQFIELLELPEKTEDFPSILKAQVMQRLTHLGIGLSPHPIGQSTKSSEVWIESPYGPPRCLSIQRSADAGRDECYLVMEDITHRKLFEEENSRLSRIVEESPISVVVTDLEGKIEYANNHTITTTGYSLEELLGNHTRVLRSPHMRDAVFEQLWMTIYKNQPWQGELQNKKKNGELYWESIIVTPLTDGNGQVKNFAALKTDITERKQLEENLSKAHDKVKELDRLKSAFLNNISHEIRTPLNAISGFSQIIAEEAASLGEAPEYLDLIQDSVKALEHLVDDMLKVSALEAGQGSFKLEYVNVDTLCESILCDFWRAHCEDPSEGPIFRFRGDRELQEKVILVDREKLKTIFDELLSNALKFTESGEVVLGYELKEDELVFYVRDTGKGISDGERPHIFSLFHHGSDHFITQHKGTGVGLTIVDRLIRLMDGRVWFESEIGKGSCFRFTGVCRFHAESDAADADMTSPSTGNHIRSYSI